jgi:hypothetical protein
MNTTYTTFLKKAICFFCLFISACGRTEPPTPLQTEIPTASSTAAVFSPTALETSDLPRNTQAVTIHTPLSHSEEYIIYSKYDASKDLEEIWAINPHKPSPFVITTSVIPRVWSPSNTLWLFTKGGSIYVATADGSDIRAVYTNEEYNGIDPFWLTDSLVLFNAYKDGFLPPDIYSLDVDSGQVTQLSSGDNKFIQAAFASESAWLRGDWLTNSLDIIKQSGEVEKFFNDYAILADFLNPDQIQRINRLNKYLIVAKEQGDAHYKFWLVSNHETPIILFDPGDGGVNFFRVSPNEQYLALTYVASDDTFIYFLDINNQDLIYKWRCPYEIGSCDFVWSPDSQSIALLYSDSNVGSSNGITSGIQVMDITTGETRKILEENVTQIIAWHFIE